MTVPVRLSLCKNNNKWQPDRKKKTRSNFQIISWDITPRTNLRKLYNVTGRPSLSIRQFRCWTDGTAADHCERDGIVSSSPGTPPSRPGRDCGSEPFGALKTRGCNSIRTKFTFFFFALTPPERASTCCPFTFERGFWNAGTGQESRRQQ